MSSSECESPFSISQIHSPDGSTSAKDESSPAKDEFSPTKDESSPTKDESSPTKDESSPTKGESSSSDDKSFSVLYDLTPTKAIDWNPKFLEDYASLLHSAKKYITKTEESSLKMKNCKVGGAGLMSILRALINSDSKITDLSLEKNNFKNIAEDVWEMLAETKLEKLNVSDSKLVNDDFMHLMEVLKRTQIIHLTVARNNLKLNENEASRFTSYLLASRLTHLNIAENNFEPATGALSFIQALPHTSITSLNLSNCHLHNDVLISLFSSVHLTSITELDVSLNKIADVQLKELCSNLKASKLVKLNLSNNDIEDAGMNFLAAGLVGSSVIELDVSSSKFSGNNCFCSCLKNTKVQRIDFSKNRISRDSMFAYPGFLRDSAVVSLDISFCRLGDDVGAKLIVSLKHSNVTHFSAARNRLGALSLRAFIQVVNHTRLRDVNFAENELSYAEFVVFADCLKRTQLNSINIAKSFCRPSSLLAIPFLLLSTEGSSITSVDISDCELHDSGFDSIADFILRRTKITHLSLSRNSLRGSVDTLALFRFFSLTHLDLSTNRIGDTEVKFLAERLTCTQLTNLNISDNYITSRGAKALAEGLKYSSLLNLNLRQNEIENDGYAELAKGVKGSFITDLDLSDNPGNRILLVEKVLLENRIAKAHLVNFFKKMAPQNIGGLFCFGLDEGTDVNKYQWDVLDYCAILYKQPGAICALGEDEAIPFSKTEILNMLTKEFPGQFPAFLSSRADWHAHEELPRLMECFVEGLMRYFPI